MKEQVKESAIRKKLRKIWADILDRPEAKIKTDVSFFRYVESWTSETGWMDANW